MSSNLERGFIVSDDGYWSGHLDFGREVGTKEPASIGRGRAAEMAVNVVLPLFLPGGEKWF